MKTKLLNSKTALLAGLTFALVGTLAGAGLSTIQAKADEAPAGVTVGELSAPGGGSYEFNGTSDGSKSTITVVGDQSAYYVRVPVANYASGNISLSMTADNATTIRSFIFKASDWKNTADAINESMTAGVEYTKTFDPAPLIEAVPEIDSANFDLAFSFITEGKTKITVNSLTVAGVSYTLTDYDPSKEEQEYIPESSFGALADWMASNATIAPNTLDKLTDNDEAVDGGAGNITIADTSKSVEIEIPLSEELTAWPSVWTNLYVKIKTTNVKYILGYMEDTTIEDNLFCVDILKRDQSAWNASTALSVSADYKVATISIADFFKGYIKGEGSISKIVFVPVFKSGATEASIEIGGMAFASKTPTFINDIASPVLTVGNWATTSSGLTVANDGELEVGEETTYEGVKLSWTKSIATDAYASATVTMFDANKTPKLRIGFYTDSEITLTVNNGATAISEQGKTYAKGYHTLDLDVSKITANTIDLRLYVDNQVTEFDGTKNVVVDDIRFYNEAKFEFDEPSSTNGFFDITTTDKGFSWTYDVANVNGGYYGFFLPIDNWYSSVSRYLVLDLTLSHDTVLSIYINNNFWDYTVKYEKGRYLLCLDTQNMNGTETFVEGVEVFFKLFCDSAVTEETSLTKQVTINEIYFSDVQLVPSTVVTINYLEETIEFDDTKYEVSASEDFGTLIQNGGAIVAGTSIFVRAKGGASQVTEIELTRPALTVATAPEATVTDNSIRYNNASAYEFKFGDGEWTKLGSWGNLTAGTEYSIQVRISATENSFASDAVTVTVKTTGTAPSGNGGGDSSEEGGSGCNSGCNSSLTLGVGGLGLVAIGAAVALLKRRKK